MRWLLRALFSNLETLFICLCFHFWKRFLLLPLLLYLLRQPLMTGSFLRFDPDGPYEDGSLQLEIEIADSGPCLQHENPNRIGCRNHVPDRNRGAKEGRLQRRRFDVRDWPGRSLRTASEFASKLKYPLLVSRIFETSAQFDSLVAIVSEAIGCLIESNPLEWLFARGSV